MRHQLRVSATRGAVGVQCAVTRGARRVTLATHARAVREGAVGTDRDALPVRKLKVRKIKKEIQEKSKMVIKVIMIITQKYAIEFPWSNRSNPYE